MNTHQALTLLAAERRLHYRAGTFSLPDLRVLDVNVAIKMKLPEMAGPGISRKPGLDSALLQKPTSATESFAQYRYD